MARIPDAFIDDLLARTDIVELGSVPEEEMAAWYAAIYFWWREGGDRSFAASLVYTVLASFGVFVLAMLQMSGSSEGLAPSLAIHAFLSTFAWALVLGTLTFLEKTGYETTTASRWWALTAWALFPLGVIGGPEAVGLGPVARSAGIAGLVPAYLAVRALRGAPLELRIASWWLAATSAGLALVAGGGSEVLQSVGRAGTIFYLHAMLLGYVTTVLAWHLARRVSLDISKPLFAHHVGVATMLAGVLAVVAAPGPGNWLAAIGAVGVWVAGWTWSLPLYRNAT